MHGPIGYGPGMHGILGVLGAIVGFLGTLILVAIVVAVLFFLIRFLIVGTKAAQLYIETNKVTLPAASTPADPAAAVVDPVETRDPSAASTSSTSDLAPVPKTRKPKTPPSA